MAETVVIPGARSFCRGAAVCSLALSGTTAVALSLSWGLLWGVGLGLAEAALLLFLDWRCWRALSRTPVEKLGALAQGLEPTPPSRFRSA